MLMGFFNERFIAPFITPSRTVSSTPIIVSDSTTVTDPIPKVIIPKINVEIPVVYDLGTTEESAIQNALEDGVVHYDNTPQPGQEGNVVVFGHSSNNIFNEGKYKFAFVLLSRLETGDIFYLTKDGTRYAYKIYDKKIVKPTAIEVLGATDRPDTATLITCDPPGTTLNRLVVIGEQISPDINANVAVAPSQTTPTEVPAVIPSNAPSLWQRLTSWL
jgi:sortase A